MEDEEGASEEAGLLPGDHGHGVGMGETSGGGGGPLGAPLLLLDATFVLEAIAPPRLHVDRFLPPACLRVLVDQAVLKEEIDAVALEERRRQVVQEIDKESHEEKIAELEKELVMVDVQLRVARGGA